jgi:hypothetical protein
MEFKDRAKIIESIKIETYKVWKKKNSNLLLKENQNSELFHPFLLFLRLSNLFIGRKQALEKSYFNLLVKLESNFSTNRNMIRPDLRSYISGHFWHNKRLNWKNSISQ